MKDAIFHDLVGKDGHGYCRTYGASVPRSLVYTQEPAVAQPSTHDLIKQMEQTFERRLEEQYKKFQEELNAIRNQSSVVSIFFLIYLWCLHFYYLSYIIGKYAL